MILRQFFLQYFIHMLALRLGRAFETDPHDPSESGYMDSVESRDCERKRWLGLCPKIIGSRRTWSFAGIKC